MAIERAIEQVEGKNNCTWGTYLRNASIQTAPLETHIHKARTKKK
jgi:hypothetical protein